MFTSFPKFSVLLWVSDDKPRVCAWLNIPLKQYLEVDIRTKPVEI